MGSRSSHRFLPFFMILPWLLSLSSSSQAYKFYVGGKDGWVMKPSEDYHHWAQTHRFRVKDTLDFKYKKGSDSVLVVKKEDYDSCNTKNPMQKMDDGDSTFNFDKSGPFYFISGNADNCGKGQKLLVVVMAVRDKPQPPPPATTPPSIAPSPGAESPKAGSPGSGPSDDPSPSPSDKSGSMRLGGPVGVALGVSIGVSLIFSSIAGLV